MKHSNIFFISLCLIFVSCTSKPDPEIVSIESIENNLLPSILIEGEEGGGMNIQKRMEYYQVPGVSIAFLNEGKISWAKGYGYTSSDSSRLVDKLTLFQAASISKPVAALAALALVEEGKIGMDDDINRYLKDWQVEENEFTVEEKVTLRRILSHTAGLTVHGFGGYASGEDVPEIKQVLNGEEPANSGRIYPDITPGVQYRYSGGGYTIMQKMLTDVTGKKFTELMEESVLSKIGMDLSTYQQPLPEKYWENAASGHRADGKMVEGKWHTYPEMAAAGLWTTPSDLLKYAMEVQKSFVGESNLILSREMTKEMLTPQMNGHGLGPGTLGSGKQLAFGHGGANEGFRCNLQAFTRLDQGVVIMTNGDRGDELMNEILRSFSKAYDWDMYKPRMKSIATLSEEELNRLAGQYTASFQGNEYIFQIRVLENHLEVIQQWDKLSFEFYPESATRFFSKDGGTEFESSEDENGMLTGFNVYDGFRQYFLEKN